MLRTIILLFFGVIFFYVTHQVLEGANLPWILNAMVIAFLATLFGMILALPLYFWMASRTDHKPWYDRFYFYTYLGLAYINFIIFFVIFRDIAAMSFWAFTQEFDFTKLYNPIAMALLLVLPALFILLGTLVVRGGVQHKKVSIAFPQLAAELENFRLLHISDLHIGDSLPIRFVENLLKAAEKIKADAVVLTGDILDGEVLRHTPELNLLRNLKSQHGTFFVPGNHEYYWRGEQSIEVFRKLGFHVLVNESRTLQVGAATLQIHGVPDPEARTFKMETPDFEKLQRTFQPNAFKILLSHQPWLADLAAPAGFDLQLSGHTHGGQFFPWNLLIGLFQKYSLGLL